MRGLETKLGMPSMVTATSNCRTTLHLIISGISIANGTSHVNSDTVKSISGTDNFMIGMLLTELNNYTSSSDSRWQNYSTSATYTLLENWD